jgi:CheY-like chemotaxis protein
MGRKILLADDSITIQKVVNLTFSDEGIDVVTVGNGELALRKLNDVRPDIVLADIYMPGKNGYEVCEYIKTNSQFSQIPVLLLVGAFEPFDQAEALRVKADGHLTKPFESRALIATVTRLLAQAPPAPSQPPPVQTQPAPTSWQGLPPDSTTTRLSIPGMPPEYKLELPKVEPIRANPVPIEQLQPPIQPPIAFPSPSSPNIFSAPPAAEKPQASAEIKGFDLTYSANIISPEPTQPPQSSPSGFSTNPSMRFRSTADDMNATTEEKLEELDLPEEMLNNEAAAAVASTASSGYSSSIDSLSPLELDEVEISSTTYQAREAENQYEDITPLDLEPLEEISYHASGQVETVLDLSPDPLPIEELTAVDAEEVLDGNIPKLESLDLSTAEPPIEENIRDTAEMVSEPEPMVESSTPNFELLPEETMAVAESSPESQPAVSEEASAHVFELDKEPAASEAAAPVFELEKEAAPLETEPVAPPPVTGEEFTFELPEEEPPAAPVETVTEVAEQTAPVFEPVPAPSEPVAQPEPVHAVTTSTVAITSIEQIPQHLIDEIVRRAIAKMSDEVVREIAWEVVPDMAELLLKKQIKEQK